MKIGDIVSLRSGGPPMTIEKIEDDGWIICSWFVRSEYGWGASEYSTFNKDTLEPSEKDI